MLKLMRDSFKHLKWILLAVVAAFIFGFVFLDMGLGGAVSGDTADQAFAARVNGETITYNDYYRALKRYEDMYRQMYGEQFTPEMVAMLRLPQQVMEALVDQRLLIQEAGRMNLQATPEEVRKKLMEIPVFVQGGKFVGMELYNRYVTGPMGYNSAAEFEADLAREIELGKIDSALTGAVIVSPKAADAEYRRQNESAKIRLVVLPAAQQAAAMSMTPAEVEAYYRANQQKYTHGEQRIVRYLIADYAKLRTQITPGEAELRKRYDAQKAQFTTPEAARVLHILVKVDPTATPDVDAAARARAESLVAQLRGGADFGALAQANSEDPSSAGNGGDMGFVERGQTVEPFERAIFSIPLNTISNPIRTTEFGYHIVKVTERRPAGVRPFEEVRGQLGARVINEMAQEQATSEINRINAIILGRKPGTAEEFSALQSAVATSNDSGYFGRNEPIAGIGSHQPLSEWAFSAKEKDISPVIGTPRGPVIAFMSGVRPSGVSPLGEVRAKVEEEAKQAKAGEASRVALAQMMAGATSIDQIAQKAGSPAREASVNRQAPFQGLTGDTNAIIEAAIAARVGEIKGPLVVKEGAVAFQVVEQKKVTDQEAVLNRAAFMDNLRQQQARNLRSTLIKRLRQSAKIEVNEELLRTPEQQPQRAGL
ncbi:MAG TPA: peptidyl-prolyl cis-trans isomerase [Thermoanaerobaculia bacterium]|nr:peptidyl-prolyl cis-trans isomerase [Thermoanaerobaculia bacterium]